MKYLSFILFVISFSAQSQTFESVKTELKDKYEYISDLKNSIATFRDRNGKSGIIDSLGNIIAPANFNYIYIHHSGCIEAGIIVKKQMKRGFINKDGSIKTPLIYDHISSSSKEGLAIIGLNGKEGVIDSLNNIQIPIEYDYITNANRKLYIVQKNKNYAVINNKGQLLTHFDFTSIKRYQDNVAIVGLPNKSTSLIDTNGKYLFPPIIGHSIENCKKNICIIRELKTNKYGILNSSGVFTTPCKYDQIEFSGNTFIVKLDNKYGIINANNVEITPLSYDIIYPRTNNLFLVVKNKNYGVLNSNNKIVLPLIYNNIEFLDDLLIVRKEGKNGVYDLESNEVIPTVYTFYRIWKDKIFAEKEGRPLILNLKTGNSSTVDADGFRPTEDFLSEQWNKQIFIKNGRFGLLSINNETLLPAEYDDLQSIYISGEFIAKRNGKFGIINSKGDIKKPFHYDKIRIIKEYAELSGKNTKTVRYSLSYRDYPIKSEFHDDTTTQD